MTDMTELELRVRIPERDEVDDATAQLLEFVYRPHLGVPIPTVGVLALTPTMFGPFLVGLRARARRDPSRSATRSSSRCAPRCTATPSSNGSSTPASPRTTA